MGIPVYKESVVSPVRLTILDSVIRLDIEISLIRV